MIAASRIKSS